MFAALTAALAMTLTTSGAASQNDESRWIGQFRLTPTANGCTLVRALQPIDPSINIILLVETYREGLMVGMFDTRLLNVLDDDQYYTAELFFDDERLTQAMMGVQKEPTSRGLLAVWEEREPMLSKLASARVVRIMQGEAVVTGAEIDGLTEAVAELRMCHARAD